ncbi:hypothetical protein ECA0768 [Pectobacterium atrosepticum SCRI1043]|uniref:Uncharacterized protein n=1 Tax=Pectobacterium atrosepticum (strain SCRI 1043 / ATCC BAA-672) TaxID=218491 RepID=Q6D951_PECAS|nr:hypothetical protein ECA0768 [Pectobacterium atrosepticum SCRI1043]
MRYTNNPVDVTIKFGGVCLSILNVSRSGFYEAQKRAKAPVQHSCPVVVQLKASLNVFS